MFMHTPLYGAVWDSVSGLAQFMLPLPTKTSRLCIQLCGVFLCFKRMGPHVCLTRLVNFVFRFIFVAVIGHLHN